MTKKTFKMKRAMKIARTPYNWSTEFLSFLKNLNFYVYYLERGNTDTVYLYFQDTQNETQFPEKADSSEKPCIDLTNYRAFFRYICNNFYNKFIYNENLECEVIIFIREALIMLTCREGSLSCFACCDTGPGVLWSHLF